MTTIPEDLKTTSLKTPNIPAAVVCPNQESILTAVKEAQDMNILNPTLVGNRNLIEQTAKKLSLNIGNLRVIETANEEESAS